MFLKIKLLATIFVGLSLTPAHAFTLEYCANCSVTTDSGWAANTLSVNYDWSACPTPSDTLTTALNTAMSAWNNLPSINMTLSVGSAVSTSFAAASSAENNGSATLTTPVIFCDPNMATDFSIKNASGATLVYWNSSGKIYGGMIGLNAIASDTGNIQNYTNTALSVLLAHELGHLLGLGHSPETYALMYYRLNSTTSLNLSEDDVDGATFLYPRSEPGGGGFLGCSSLAFVNGGESRNNTGQGKAFSETALLFLSFFVIWAAMRNRSIKSKLPP